MKKTRLYFWIRTLFSKLRGRYGKPIKSQVALHVGEGAIDKDPVASQFGIVGGRQE